MHQTMFMLYYLKSYLLEHLSGNCRFFRKIRNWWLCACGNKNIYIYIYLKVRDVSLKLLSNAIISYGNSFKPKKRNTYI